MFSSALFFIPLLLSSYVSAHGFVHEVTIGGTRDTGLRPFGNGGGQSAIRQINSPNPNTGANNPALNCGPGARRASQVLNANPGDTLTFDWRGADLSFWPHNTGPMITYLANCGNVPCNEFDSSNARWFKVHQVGRNQGRNDWVQGALMNGDKARAKLPDNLAPGNYLVRHEIIALHLAQGRRGAEFYPSCTQIRVGGSGTGRPTEDELVSFPGAYSDDDPGILVNAFSGREYAFPGPRIARFVNDPASSGGNGGNGGNSGNNGGNNNNGGNGNGNGNGNAPTSSRATSAPQPTGNNNSGSGNSGSGTPSKPKKVCKLKKSSSARVARSTNDASNYPRHFSRVMRRLVEEGASHH